MLGYLLEKRPQEIYRIKIVDGGFLFKIKESFFLYILGLVREEIRIKLLETSKATIDGVIVFDINLPYIKYPNYKHKSTDWEKLGKCAELMSLLLSIGNRFPKDGENYSKFALSESSQLMAISTNYSEGDWHSAPISVGFSQRACELLSEKYKEHEGVNVCEDVMNNIYLHLSSKTKREFDKGTSSFERYSGGFVGISASVRNGGVPHFIVPGNCACLGANPDRFKYDRDLDSHNMDSSLQQMAMLAGVVTFWNDVLRPLATEKK